MAPPLATQRLDEWRLRVKSGGAGVLARTSEVPSIADVAETANHPAQSFIKKRSLWFA